MNAISVAKCWAKIFREQNIILSKIAKNIKNFYLKSIPSDSELENDYIINSDIEILINHLCDLISYIFNKCLNFYQTKSF